MNLTLDQMQRNMMNFTERWAEENRNRISVTVTPKKVVEETTEPPVFIHPQIKYLYEYGYEIPLQYIEEIKALPRETLLKDLNAVVYDGIARYHLFSKSDWEDKHNWFALHTLFLLRELKANESLEVVLDFLSQSEEFLEYWLGDMLTEDIWSVVALCGSNNLERLNSFMKETGRYTWARTAVHEAVNQLALHEMIPKQDAVDWVRKLIQFYIDNRQIENLIDSDMNGSLIGVCLDLQATELLPLIKQMLDDNIANKNYAGDYEEVQKEINRTRSHAKREIETIEQAYGDILKRIEKDNRDNDSDESYNDENEYDDYEEITQPVPIQRSEQKLGRNDRCFCGSGIKYKKCHGK
ncbi:MAG: DUF1186 domain-containing protein [Bacteroidetes bacterium]|nr:DUF1186 domain-containing protein [Bacteroidota bacterium]